MKNKAIKGFNMATFAASTCFVFAMAISSTHANAAQSINVINSTSFHQINYTPSAGIGYKNYAYRCYKRCWVNRYGRHCNTTCN